MKKILIVLHDSILLTTFKIRLHNKALKINDIILVENSSKALEILKKTPVGLLITDLELSEFDGFNLLVYLAKEMPQSQLVVLLNKSMVLSTIHCLKQPKSLTDLTEILTKISANDFQMKLAEDMSVVDFFQLIHFAKKTCLLEVGSNRNKGLIFFNQGIIYDSFCSNTKGERTILNMFGKKCVEINFRHLANKAFRQKITTSLATLIRNGVDFKYDNELNSTTPIVETIEESEIIAEIQKTNTDKQRVTQLLNNKLKEIIAVEKDVKKEKNENSFQSGVSKLETSIEAHPKITQIRGINDMSLEDSLKPVQEVDGYLASAIFDMSGEVLVQHNNSKYNVSLIGANAISMINSAVKAVNGAGLGKCNFIQVNSERGVFGAVWAVEDQSVAAVLLEPNANVGMAKLMLAKVGDLAGSRLA